MRILLASIAVLALSLPAAAQNASGSAAANGQAPAGAAQPSQNAGNAGNAGAASDVLVPVDNDHAPVPQLNLMAGQVQDMDVIGADNAKVGEVKNVLGGANGNVTAISVDVGGFLGIGSKSVILMLSDVKLDMGRLRTNLTKQQIEHLPGSGG